MQMNIWEKRQKKEEWYLAGFILGDFMLGVLSTLLALAVGAAGFGDLVYGISHQ